MPPILPPVFRFAPASNGYLHLGHALSALLNVLNLIPVWSLDGGQAALALSKLERIGLLTICLLLWIILGEGIFFLVALGA